MLTVMCMGDAGLGVAGLVGSAGGVLSCLLLVLHMLAIYASRLDDGPAITVAAAVSSGWLCEVSCLQHLPC